MAISKLNPSAGGIPFGNTAGRPTAATGKLYSNGETARIELYTSAGAWENIVQEVPGVSSISGAYNESTGSATITINGTNFVSGAIAAATGTNGVEIQASSTTFNSLVQLAAVFTGLSNANEPYDIKVTNPSNLFGMLPDALFINANPVWTTASGSLGTFQNNVSMSVSATATDETAITYSLASGSTLPSGVTLNSASGLISGTPPDIASNTTYTFTINASDGVNPVVPRTFSFISNAAPVWVTSAGSLGSFLQATSISVTISATDVSDSITYSLASGSSLPSGITLNSSTGVISGTLPSIASNTTYTFTINASDGVNTIPRTFSFISNFPILSGGTLASDSTYYYRVFPSNQNLVVSLGSVSTDILMVGGGGAGDNDHGGGGGAGGILYHASRSLSAGSYAIAVGSGGLGNSGVPLNGGNTTFTDGASVLTAFGGGRGSTTNSDPGGAGGSGGGGGGANSGTGTRAGGSTTQTSNNGGTGYGNNGGTGGGTAGEPGGGGGGAGQAGYPSTSNQAGNGGNGLNIWSVWLSAVASSMSGDTIGIYNTGYIAGGGGGGSTSGGNQVQAAGGLGGGGRGDCNVSAGLPGVANTGGGGGAHANGGSTGADGGSGVVIIRYLKSAVGG